MTSSHQAGAAAAAIADEPPAVAIRGLRCELGGRAVFESLDLEIPAGSFVGVFGANGAGKTTLLRVMLGLQGVASGHLEVLGQPPARARMRIGYVTQRDPLGADSGLSVRSYVAAAWRAQRWGPGWRTRAARRDEVEAALASMELLDLAEQTMDSLSGGQRQRVRIAQALANPMDMLLLDEPLSNLDPQAQQRILAVTRALCRKRGLTVLMTAHDINALLPHMDRVLYLANGHGRIGTVDEVVNAQSLTALYGLPMSVARDGGYVFIHPVSGFMAESGHCGGDHEHHHSAGAA